MFEVVILTVQLIRIFHLLAAKSVANIGSNANIKETSVAGTCQLFKYRNCDA
jgi:hypothetical protein